MVTAREDGRIGAIPYTFELTFHCDTARVDGRVKFHFAGQKLGRLSTNQRDGSSGFLHEEKLRFKLFPAVSSSAMGVRDLPFAVAETTNRYVEGNYWTALTDNQAGVAIFNRGTMGSVREEDGGFSVPLAFAMYYIWGTRMLQGDFEYEFALYPFTGDWQAADLHRRALEYNFPMLSVSSVPGIGTLGDEVRLIEAGSDHVLLSALYPNGSGVLARLYEYQGRSGEAPVKFRTQAGRVQRVDLLGEHARPVTNALTLKPWQIQTLKFVRQQRE
jgi:alpha-mannosidase